MEWRHVELLESNYEQILTPLLKEDDVCLNMSSCVSSLAIIQVTTAEGLL